MGRIYYSPTTRQRAIALVLDDQIPVAEAAREIGCSPITITNWIEKYRPSDCLPSKQASFVPINIIDTAPPSAEIILPNGITIRLSDASPQYLAKLLQALVPSC